MKEFYEKAMFEVQAELYSRVSLPVKLSLSYFDTISSTMDKARELASNLSLSSVEELEVGVVVANSQTAGRGREGRGWASESGAGLYTTLFLHLPVQPHRLVGVSLLVGLALYRVANAVGVNAMIKWPNDLVVTEGVRQLKKLAGVLVESYQYERQDGQLTANTTVLVGVGVNTGPRNFPEGVPGISFADLNSAVTVTTVMRLLLVEFIALLPSFLVEGFGPFREAIERCLALIGEEVAFGEHRGVLVGLGEQGELLVKTERCLEKVVSGEVRPVYWTY